MGRKKASSTSTADNNGDTSKSSSVDLDLEVESNPKRSFPFKNKSYETFKNNSSGKKIRILKNFKQIVQYDRSLAWKPEEVDYTYSSIDALPSFKPQKKYSDISGLPASYTDPHSKLRFATCEEFSRIKTLPSDIVSGLLLLRKAATSNG